MNSFFLSTIHEEEDTSWLNYLNIVSDKYLQEKIINNQNFGVTHHSESLKNDKNFLKFMNFICQRSYSILDNQGYDLKNYSLMVKDLWVQEFSKKGGGNHNTHVHASHISGFYFLKCSDKTSFPVFHDPRPGKLMIQLPEKNVNEITEASEKIIFKPKPGTFVFFNSFLGHEFVVDQGLEQFRFIHFNIEAVLKNLIQNKIDKL